MPGSAVAALVMGGLVYVVDRDWTSTQFLAAFAGLQPGVSGLFGPLGPVLPSFLHAYAFALLLILLIGRTRRAAAVGAGAWFACAAALEFLQAPSLQRLFIDHAVPASAAPLLHSIQSYVLNGHFDPGDLVAAGLGCAAASAISSVREAPP